VPAAVCGREPAGEYAHGGCSIKCRCDALVVPRKLARGTASVSGCDRNLALSGWGRYDAKILAELRTMRRRIGVHKYLRRTGRQLRLKLSAELVIHKAQSANEIDGLAVY
jgi:hypothetical protein